jgi:hypothetical protein
MIKKGLCVVGVYLTVLTIILSVMGCVYTEGDDKAQEAFELMTTQEKAMHDKAVDGHYESYLVSVRNAVRKRNTSPNERAIPFIDIANVIKFCDENILVPVDSWGESTRKKARASKFSLQDPSWYKKIIKATEQDTPLEIEQTTEKITKSQVVRNTERLIAFASKVPEDEVSELDLLPLKEYRDIKSMARGCDGAINIIELAASKGNPLTNKDADDILYQKSVCETKKLNDNM